MFSTVEFPAVTVPAEIERSPVIEYVDVLKLVDPAVERVRFPYVGKAFTVCPVPV